MGVDKYGEEVWGPVNARPSAHLDIGVMHMGAIAKLLIIEAFFEQNSRI